jgi:hypothetical protein
MQTEQLSTAIAHELASLWGLHQSPAFDRYLQDAYGVTISSRPAFRCVYIGETEDGDFDTGPKGGLVKHWWQVDSEGLREIDRPKLDWDTDETFYPTPELLFFAREGLITTVESLGRRMRRWVRGKIQLRDNTVSITELEVL